jgi:hypothetical protein
MVKMLCDMAYIDRLAARPSAEISLKYSNKIVNSVRNLQNRIGRTVKAAGMEEEVMAGAKVSCLISVNIL